MKVVHVIPISRGILLDRLSYFTSQNVALGSTVSVPLRKKIVHAVVVGIEDASTIKSDLKSSSFALRKLEHVESHDFLSEAFMQSAAQTADYYASSTGSVLHALIPKTLLAGLREVHTPELSEKIKNNNTSSEQLVLQAEDEERFTHYKSLIREEFARHASVFMCVPTVEDISKAQRALEKGIEQYTYIFHSGLTKKRFVELWNKLLAETHPVLIVATGQYMCVPRKDIGTIIVEREGSRAYKIPSRPFLDIRTFASIYAKKIHARLLFGDML